MNNTAKILIHPRFKIGDISPRLYGAFLEPIGTMVNGSMFNPKHPTADDKGFRRDFMKALTASGLPAVRLPGGNFVSGWDWKDSIGKTEDRKTRLDPAWKQYIPNYHSAPPGDYAALLGGSLYFEDYIDTIASLCDFVQAQYRSPKKLMLSFDEYGTMAREPQKLNPGRGLHNFLAPHYTPDQESKYIRHDPDNMTARRFPQSGDMLGALTSASTILAFLRHADRVKIGCMTGGLQILAAANRENVWKPAAYYPYTQLIQYGRGVSLQAVVDCDTFDIPGYIMNDTAQFYTQTGVKFLDTAAAYDEENGTLNIFIINRDWESDNDAEIDTNAFKDYRFIEHIQLYSDDMEAMNTYENPETIVPAVNPNAKFRDGKIAARLKKLSWNVFRLEK